MKTIFWGIPLVAVLATGCHSSPTPGETTGPATTAQPAATARGAVSPAPSAHEYEHPMAAMPGMANPASARTEAMRLHDAAMNQMEALTTEQERLTSALAKLPATSRQAARLRRTGQALHQADQQMMAWMHQLQEPDSATQPRAQVEAYWRQQLPTLHRLDQRITAALDSAKALR
jgi:hypothetical protein